MPGHASRKNGQKGGRPRGASRLTKLIRAKVQADQELTAEATKEQIRRGSQFDIRALFDAQGNVKPIHQLTAEEAMPIAGFEVVKRNLTSGDDATDVILKIKIIDRAKYVEMAGRHHGLFNDKLAVTVDETHLTRLDQGRLRARARATK